MSTTAQWKSLVPPDGKIHTLGCLYVEHAPLVFNEIDSSLCVLKQTNHISSSHRIGLIENLYRKAKMIQGRSDDKNWAGGEKKEKNGTKSINRRKKSNFSHRSTNSIQLLRSNTDPFGLTKILDDPMRNMSNTGRTQWALKNVFCSFFATNRVELIESEIYTNYLCFGES